MADHEFQIVDAEARADFEKLLGHEIRGPVVRMMHDTYLEHAGAIQAIQMAAAFRLKDARS
jgi:hypothetical protein